MKEGVGTGYALIGALAAFPRRVVRQALERRGDRLCGRISRATSVVVFAHSLLGDWNGHDIVERVRRERAAGRRLLSEKGFMRELGLMPRAGSAQLGADALADRSGLHRETLDLLVLFDAFESHEEPFTFRDLILARKYRGLIADGAGWNSLARSLHRTVSVSSLTSLALQAEGDCRIYAVHSFGLTELDGQALLPLGQPDAVELNALFELARAAEQEGRYADAISIYREYLRHEPGNAVAHFNCGNCLRSAGDDAEAALAYLAAIKRDPNFVEAWFNLAELNVSQGRTDAARRNLLQALAVDRNYADAVYNLASLEHDLGNFAEARKWWARYLELDAESSWARTAARALRLIDIAMAARNAR